MDTLINSYLQNIILQELKETLEYINVRYPKYFKRKYIDQILEQININIIPITQKRKENNKKKVMRKMLTRSNRNTGIYISTRKKVDNDKRCVARIWANGKIQTSGLHNIFGERCSLTKSSKSDKYCHSHLKNNPHMDYDKEPSLMVKNNYYKNNKSYKKKQKERT